MTYTPPESFEDSNLVDADVDTDADQARDEKRRAKPIKT
jgi:hypothetical protein